MSKHHEQTYMTEDEVDEVPLASSESMLQQFSHSRLWQHPGTFWAIYPLVVDTNTLLSPRIRA